MKPETDEKLKCESCGEDFSCGANTGKCWCFEVDLSEENLDNLKANFDTCLCPKCLKNSNSKLKM